MTQYIAVIISIVFGFTINFTYPKKNLIDFVSLDDFK